MTAAAHVQMVQLTMTQREAEYLRSLVGSLSPHDFASDHVVFNLIRSRHPNAVEDNTAIANALIELLGHGIGEYVDNEPRACPQCRGSGLTAWDGLHERGPCIRCNGSGRAS